MKLKISHPTLRELLLDLYVDKDGNKVSDREIISNEKLMKVSGLYSKLSNNKMVPSSVGLLSYYKRKLNLLEKDVYEYHREVTKRIGEDVTFREFSKKNNEGHKKKPVPTKNYDRKYNLIKYFELDSSMMGWDLDVIEKVIFDNLEELGINKLDALSEFEDYLANGGE